MPLLVGLDGVRKMSKSYDNYIAFNDSAKDIFGKIMSISDEAMPDYYRLLLNLDQASLNELKECHPMDNKKKLAFELTAKFYGRTVAEKELEQFSMVFSKGNLPEEMPSFSLKELSLEKPSILNLLASTELFESKGQIRRIAQQGGLKLNGERIEDVETLIDVSEGQNDSIIKAGKKIFVRFTR